MEWMVVEMAGVLLDGKVLSLVQVCGWCLPGVSMVENLYILEKRLYGMYWQDDTINMLLLR